MIFHEYGAIELNVSKQSRTMTRLSQINLKIQEI